MENELVPYQAVAGISARRVLVLAPHPDDEAFGCGGAIAAHGAEGTPVDVVVLTDGAAYGDVAERQAESRAAAKVLGSAEPSFWGIPDRQLRADDELVRRIAEHIRTSGADLIYAPSPWEIHPDHRQAAQAAVLAAQATGARIAFYEIGAPLRPNLLLDITPHLAKKQAAAACFASQQARQDYAGHVFALNRYRTYTLPPEVVAAEAYLLLDAAQLRQQLPMLLASHPVTAAMSVAAATQPLVSVLVRSIDRATLQGTLDSIAVQSYPSVEVLVIAANPGHQTLPERCGPFAMRLVPTDMPLARSQTANRALTLASGDYLLFLDDDDWLLPDHLSRLVAVLQAQPQVHAAYTGVFLADESGKPLGQVLDLPFDSVRQLAGNLTPIHAVLFRKTLVDRGLRFDEALDRYEDWDFWLQAARHTVFAHVPGASAAYRIHQSSGVHTDAGPMGAATQLIYEKWKAAWSAGQGAKLMERAWALDDVERQLAQSSQEVAKRDGQLAQMRDTLHQQAVTLEHQHHQAEHLHAAIAARDSEINALRGSTSWRVTAPLRWLMARLRPGG
ncbi:PIG-L family deacetylase [Ramlibacter sp.]|uniref:PIG-L family deacetylase n=1 Tax=Ramlibacter sp. TaxID=1917967 RepID=UPI003D14C83B